MVPKKIFQIWIELVRPQRRLAIQSIVLAILVSSLEIVWNALAMPLLQILGGGNLTELQLPGALQHLSNLYKAVPEQWQLLSVILSFLLITVCKNALQYLSSISINDLQLRIGTSIRRQCAERFLQLEVPFYSQSSLGELLSYVNEQSQRSEALSSHLLETLRECLIITALLVFLISISPILTLIAVASLTVLVVLLKTIIRSVHLHGQRSAELIEQFSILITEIIRGIRVIKSFGLEKIELDRAGEALQDRYRAELSAFQYSSAIAPLTETSGVAVLLLLLALGSTVLAGASANVLPLLLTYTLVLLRLLPRVSHLNSLRSQIALLSGSLESITQFLTTTQNLHLPNGQRSHQKLTSEIVFEGVTFTFPASSEATLKDINLTLRRGSTTALVGLSGSGKSTLADLLIRFHDPDAGGHIWIDGTDLRDLQVNAWRQTVAMVSQDTFLFNSTIRENIACGRSGATDQEILEASRRAYAYEFIQNLPEGFETIAGDRGTRLSGGQRQRIAIARAILRDPDVLILDEATSALDSTSERIVQKAIEEVSCDRTVIVIAHRLSTIERADNIVVMHQGRVIEQGTHQQLLELKGQYWSLYSAQASSSPTIELIA